jgi:hypothetical protein
LACGTRGEKEGFLYFYFSSCDVGITKSGKLKWEGMYYVTYEKTNSMELSPS